MTNARIVFGRYNQRKIGGEGGEGVYDRGFSCSLLSVAKIEKVFFFFFVFY